jgi:hypothetical protein
MEMIQPVDEQTNDLFMEEWLCDQLAEPVDISMILREMGRTHLRESVDVDHQNYC